MLLCSGKIYYELEQKRTDLKRDNVAIVRMEQLYPLPKEPLRAALADVPDGTPVFWVQEEPENMGAWRFLPARTTGSSFSIGCRWPASTGKAQPARPPAPPAATAWSKKS